MSKDEGEKWIVNLIRETRMGADAKIDLEKVRYSSSLTCSPRTLPLFHSLLRLSHFVHAYHHMDILPFLRDKPFVPRVSTSLSLCLPLSSSLLTDASFFFSLFNTERHRDQSPSTSYLPNGHRKDTRSVHPYASPRCRHVQGRTAATTSRGRRTIGCCISCVFWWVALVGVRVSLVRRGGEGCSCGGERW